ncbi:MAG: glycosyltransferase family 2 protein [Desulfobacteraceae bacterium]|nr:glycosyltransferase family 2 protein [Desulfobacteraceae bacterium]
MEDGPRNRLQLSLIIPTYNRRELVLQAIDSALQFAANVKGATEIIVVDDASTDATYEQLRRVYQKELLSGLIRLIRSGKNMGVTGAKNLGAANAGGEWLLFIDSDDLLIPDTVHDLVKIINIHNTYPFILFRCVDLRTGELIGPPVKEPYDLTLRDFLNNGAPGECLPVVKASVFAQNPYRADLRGCEGLTYAGIIQRFGPARVETLVARRYRTDNEDRLSSGEGLFKRACYISKYYRLILKNYFWQLYFITTIKTTLKLIYFWIHCIFKKKEME